MVPAPYVPSGGNLPQNAQARWAHPGNWLAWLGAVLLGGVAAGLSPFGVAAGFLGALVVAWLAGRGAKMGTVLLFGGVGVGLAWTLPPPPPPMVATTEPVAVWFAAPPRPMGTGWQGIGRLAGEASPVLVRVAHMGPVPAGTWLRGDGRVRPLSQHLPGGYRAYLARQGVRGEVWLAAAMPGEPAPGLTATIARWRHQAGLQLDSALRGGARASLARALLLGDRSLLDRDTRTAFQVTGTMHLVAVSGGHLSLLLVMLWAVLTPLGANRNAHRWWQAPLLIALLTGYALLTGGEPPAIRALLMAALLLLGRALHRQATGWNLWGAALLLQLVADPGAVRDPAFQLSYAAVAGLLFGMPRVQVHVPRSWQWLLLPLAATAIAQLVLMPLQILLFGQLPVYGVLANLLLQPLAAVALGTGLLLLVLAWVPGLGFVLAAWTAAALDWQMALARHLAQWPGAAWHLAPSPVLIGSLCLALIALVLWVRRRWPGRHQAWVWV